MQNFMEIQDGHFQLSQKVADLAWNDSPQKRTKTCSTGGITKDWGHCRSPGSFITFENRLDKRKNYLLFVQFQGSCDD
jgi:hypothetical protein